MDFNSDFSDMLLELSAAKVDYLVVGAYAVAAHGHPRATGDLDIWIRADLKTAPRIMYALKNFGAPMGEIAESDFANPSIIFQIGVPPGRIDILTAVSGLEFNNAWENRVTLMIEGVPFPVLGFDDLIANKRASGRPKDIVDLETLLDSRDG